MKRRGTSTLNLIRKQRYESPVAKSVHSMLSESHRAYSVFRPAPHNYFPLFQVIFLLPDPKERSKSPRGSVVNLKATFERLRNNIDMRNGEDQAVINAFINEFENSALVQPPQQLPAQTLTVSEESLFNAGVKLATPAGILFGISASHTRTTTRQLRLQEHFSEAYRGGSQLQGLIWRHAHPVFILILEELQHSNNFPSAPRDRGLVRIVTTRIVSRIGVSKSAESVGSASAETNDGTGTLLGIIGGKRRKHVQEDYDDLYGVSGLRFIVFPVECLEDNKWRIYGGISVCDSDINNDDDTFTDDTRSRDNFYRAQKWLLGEGDLLGGSNSNIVSRSHSVHKSKMSPSGKTPNFFNNVSNENHDSDKQGFLSYIDVVPRNAPLPWADVDIRPFLNEFAQKQCMLASYYRKTASGPQALSHAVHLLRSALRKCCFESTVRALYDLSGCYLRGVGVNLDFGTGKLLRICASGLRRNYEARSLGFVLLAAEVASYRGPAIERKFVSLLLFSRRTLTALTSTMEHSGKKRNLSPILFCATASSNTTRMEDSGPVDSTIAAILPDDEPKKKKARRPASLLSAVRSRGGKLRVSSSSRPPPLAKQEITFSPSRMARKLCVLATCFGDAEAMNSFGLLLQNGEDGVAKDVREAARLYRQAVDLRNAETMNNLSLLLQNGEDGVAKHSKKALRLYQQFIDLGNAEAVNNFCSLLQRGGIEIAKDVTEAVKLYRQGTDLGNADAMVNLGKMYQRGEGVTKDIGEAVKLYRHAINLGNVNAMVHLGWLLVNGRNGVARHVAEGLQLFRQAVDLGNPWAMVDLGFLLENGENGVAKDVKTAENLFHQAAVLGHADMIVKLGEMFEEGSAVVANDLENAVRLYRRAARLGNAAAMAKLKRILGNNRNEPIQCGTRPASLAFPAVADRGFRKAGHPLSGRRIAKRSTDTAGVREGRATGFAHNDPPRTGNASSDLARTQSLAKTDRRKYLAFISHGGPDKLSIAKTIRKFLTDVDVHAFFDFVNERTSDYGFGARRHTHAMAEAEIGIFVLSPEFASRRLPMRELRYFLERDRTCKIEGRRRPMLLPVFYRLSLEECREADVRVYGQASQYGEILISNGFFNQERQKQCSTETAAEALKKVAMYSGVEVFQHEGGENVSLGEVIAETVSKVEAYVRESQSMAHRGSVV